MQIKFEFIKTCLISYPTVYPFEFFVPTTTNLWIFNSWTYLPEDGSIPHPNREPEYVLIANVDDEML